MRQITKEFAESLLKRVQAGQHINTTCGEEEQLIRAWMYWHENYYKPRLEELLAHQQNTGASFGIAGSEASMQGGDTLSNKAPK